MRRLLVLTLLLGLLAVPVGAQSSIECGDSGDKLAINTSVVRVNNATVAVWTSLTATDSNQRQLYWEGDNSPQRAWFRISSQNGQWTCEVMQTDATVRTATGASSPSTNQWYCLACTVDAGTGEVTLYEDGVEIASAGSWDGTWMGGGSVANFCNQHSSSTGHYTGRISQFQVWHRTLTDEQVASACVSPVGLPAGPTALRNWRPFWGTTKDLGSTPGADGTNTGVVFSGDGPPVYIPGGGQSP